MPEPTTSVIARHVFVYGTLRRGDVRDITRLHPAPRFVGMASVAGVLYDLGPYPGVVLGGPGRVCGEVYAISAELERQLDAIEEVFPQSTGEYSKQEASALLDESPVSTGVAAAQLQCLVYEINPEFVVGKKVIPAGDWLEGRRLSS